MKIDKETEKNLQEMQMLEQNLQNTLLQKQAFQMEINETENALDEIGSSGDEIYKIIGQLLLKTEKEKVRKELDDKKSILGLRIKTLEKQERVIMEKMEKLQKEISLKIK